MKNLSKGTQFLIGCAIVFALGAALTLAGYIAGGLKALDDKTTAAPDMTTTEEVYEFSSIESTGYLDLEIAGPKYYDEMLEDHEIRDFTAEPGKVIVISRTDSKAPEVSTDGGRLIINGGGESFTSLGVHNPTVIVFCGEGELESIKVSSGSCDADINGVSFKNAELEMNAGDVGFRDVVSGGIKVDSEAGEIRASGMLKGMTDLHTDAGDIEVDTFDGIRTYTIDASTGAGEISIGDEENDFEGIVYKQEGGDNTLKLRTDAGDIEIGEK